MVQGISLGASTDVNRPERPSLPPAPAQALTPRPHSPACTQPSRSEHARTEETYAKVIPLLLLLAAALRRAAVRVG